MNFSIQIKIQLRIGIAIFVSLMIFMSCRSQKQQTVHPITYYQANNPNINYVGRVEFSNPSVARFWNPGVYIRFDYQGDSCEIIIKDELPWSRSHNYITIIIDDQKEERIQLAEKINNITIGKNLEDGVHHVTICKSTESGIGYIEFLGMWCHKLLEPQAQPSRKMEFYGNSITCGTGSDASIITCDSLEWHDKHNAYMSYGPQTARMLNSQWMLTSVSGIGMVHSCCELDILISDVYDKINLRANEIPWDFSKYQPDVVTIALGQNDGIQDSTLFCSTYIEFVKTIRGKYPEACIVCLNSPMESEELGVILKKYILSIVDNMRQNDDQNVYSFFFSRSYNSGCDSHPDIEEHTLIAEELTEFIKQTMSWE